MQLRLFSGMMTSSLVSQYLTIAGKRVSALFALVTTTMRLVLRAIANLVIDKVNFAVEANVASATGGFRGATPHVRP